ncbi:ATP-binding protein [Methylobacter tundripaludum]|uniref:histidine kinase n=1 Tax=Methylobacter tundripaludum (strain ATCC BAA-1195 / DSM 17260 / SV96) TaxID=697282 RepID=G3IV25_METTV|nr:ATP-binding protein [Methylobacter tundripaludum]EGW22821.1 multi-sensor hybrid histidine kinase [Methylobacter tundripaludum SV96]
MALINFRQQSFRKKLILALFIAALLAFAAASAAFMLFEHLSLESRARQVMEPYAQLVSVSAEAAVAFEDSGRSQEILDTLRANPQILEAQINLRDGRMLARYSIRSNTTLPQPLPTANGIYLDRNTAVLVQRLQDNAYLYLAMNLDELNRQTRNTLRVFAIGVIVLLATVALGLLAALQKSIVGPISTLAETVEQVHSHADYSQRVLTSGTDEVARLSQSFNAMMDAIQEREDDLRRLMLFQRTLLDNVAHGIISTAPDGTVTSFNRAAESLLGYTADEVIGKQTPALWHDTEEVAQYALHLSEELGETILPGFAVFSARPRRNLTEEKEWTFIRKNGARVPVLLSVTALRTESGQITGFVGLTYDLTERKQAENELRRHKDQLEETVQQRTADLLLARDAAEAANKAKGLFLAHMSHELRTPLNGILGYAQILQRDELVGERKAAALNIIRQSSEYLRALIDDILDLSRIETGRLDFVLSNISLAKFLRGVTDIVGLRARQKGLEFSCELAADLPAGIRCDERRLRQVLLNLLTNAVKFTDSGQVVLRVGRVGPSRFSFAVEDTGIGIEQNELELIFRPFEQVGDLQRRLGGTGLGLAISRQLMRYLGSDIVVESRVGKGSTFRFEVELQAASSSTPVLLNPMQVITGYKGPHRKVLIVDDVASNRAVLVDLLSPLGFGIIEACDGIEALELAQAAIPDLILMDIVMPKMDGEEVTHLLRQLPALAQVPIIALSASASNADETKCLQAGANAFLPKPVDQDELLAQMAALMQLEWITVPRTELTPNPGELAEMLILPPAAEMQELYRLALTGNMRDILQYAERIAGIDPSYQAFATHLRQLANGYQSKAILAFAEAHLT